MGDSVQNKRGALCPRGKMGLMESMQGCEGLGDGQVGGGDIKAALSAGKMGSFY